MEAVVRYASHFKIYCLIFLLSLNLFDDIRYLHGSHETFMLALVVEGQLVLMRRISGWMRGIIWLKSI
ncbi:hypothetical protein HanHA89_Chr03g0103091 [Helianthus annuus]|nr:hypothetical protein HanHA89_Chr03g0103091 [Helianthus annuus]